MPSSIPSPWGDFLSELDGLIDEPVELHCIGGFVVAVHYGLTRPTADVDVLVVKPASLSADLSKRAGLNSPLYRKHKVYLQVVPVFAYPEDYADRLAEMFPGKFRNLRLFALDPYDLALSKLERNSPRDREDVLDLAQRIPLDVTTLRNRYNEEMRPYVANQEREDRTLTLWVGAIEELRSKNQK